MKTLVFILVIMEGTKIIDEADMGSFQKCSWHMKQINISHKNNYHNYQAFCKPKFKKKEEE